MNNTINTYLGSLNIGSRQTHKNLSMYPIICPEGVSLDYLLLDEALAGNVIEIAELNQGGSVPELKVVNKAQKMVLLLDGEELVGAKQNRIINTTILIAANSTTTIPVSCVEQGRWSYRSNTFHSEERVMSHKLRAMKAEHVNLSKKLHNSYRSDQGALWGEIADKAERLNACSDSMAMSSIFEKERPNLQEYAKQFRAEENQVGAVFLINGKIVGLDSFGKQTTFSKVFKKLIESYALDAIDWLEEEKKTKKKVEGSGNGVSVFLESIRKADAQSSPSVALGKDVRLESDSTIGFALDYEGALLHLSAFAREKKADGETPHSRMERFSRRRRARE
jgi:hypothetical protein